MAAVSSRVPPSKAETAQGNLSPLSLDQIRKPSPICFNLLKQLFRDDLALERASMDKSTPASSTLVAKTISVSVIVEARWLRDWLMIFIGWQNKGAASMPRGCSA